MNEYNRVVPHEKKKPRKKASSESEETVSFQLIATPQADEQLCAKGGKGRPFQTSSKGTA